MASSRAATMPITTDVLELERFVEPRDGQRILDMGTGSGIIALSLARRAAVDVVGVDISADSLREAKKNLERERSFLQGGVTFLPLDLRDIEGVAGLGRFDQVVCNPPYFRKEQGRLPRSGVQAAARYEITCTMPEIIRAAAVALGPGGVFNFAQIPSRGSEVLRLLADDGFALSRIQFVYSGGNIRLLLFRAEKIR